MRNISVVSLLVFNFFLLTACGFQPMYAKRSSENVSAASLTNVQIANIPNREGQILRNNLVDRFYQNGYPAAPEYRLEVSAVEESIADLDITIRSDATREQLRLSADIQLVEINTGKSLMHRKLSAIGSYNVLESQYTTRVSRQNIRENLLRDLALQAERQVVLKLNNLPSK